MEEKLDRHNTDPGTFHLSYNLDSVIKLCKNASIGAATCYMQRDTTQQEGNVLNNMAEPIDCKN